MPILRRWAVPATFFVSGDGAHGWSHRRLGGRSEEEQEAEVRRSVEQLRRLVGPVRLFAYPFGGSYDEVTQAVLRRTGIAAACAGGDAAVTAESPLLALPRVEVRAWSLSRLRERLADALR